MDADLTLPLAFMVGLTGAGHCWAMCGALVGGVFVGRSCAENRCQTLRLMLRSHLSYHSGRVLAYTLIGGLAAGLGQVIVLVGGVGRAQAVLYSSAGLGVVLAGMRALIRTPGASGCGVQVVMPSKRIARTVSAFGLAGFLNGVMPCALVFSLALKAATASSVATGAALLFAFGLGTVPAMALAGCLAHGLGGLALLCLRRAAGLLVIGLGLQAIWAGYKLFQVMLHL
jgi:sulfite exporter TauE/SafE